jgi:hypothetical protein
MNIAEIVFQAQTIAHTTLPQARFADTTVGAIFVHFIIDIKDMRGPKMTIDHEYVSYVSDMP